MIKQIDETRNEWFKTENPSYEAPTNVNPSNMRQVFDLVDRIVVFRRGQICANLDIKNGDYTGEDVVAYITGAKTGAEYESTV